MYDNPYENNGFQNPETNYNSNPNVSFNSNQGAQPHYTEPTVEPPVITSQPAYTVDEYYKENFSQEVKEADGFSAPEENIVSEQPAQSFNSGYIPVSYSARPVVRRRLLRRQVLRFAEQLRLQNLGLGAQRQQVRIEQRVLRFLGLNAHHSRNRQEIG